MEAREAETWDAFSGRLEAIERVDVRSRVSGVVDKIHFREGALVAAGTLLVTIDPAPYAADVERLEAQVESADARVGFTRSEVERARQLAGSPALSARELDSRTNAFKEAVASLRAAKAALQVASLNLGYTEVRAPVDGRVGRLQVTVGNLIPAGAGSPALTTIVSVDPIYASFNADEGVVTRILAALSPEAAASAEIGRFPIEITTAAADGAWRQGRLQLIDNQVDAASGTVRLRAIVENKDGRLIAGQFVQIRMARPRQGPVVAITERAIGTDQDKKFVLVVGSDNKAQYREVKLGALAGGLRVVTEGLQPNEHIVVAGLQRVKPGMSVAPQPVTMDGKLVTNQAQATSAPAQTAPQ